MSEIKVTYVDHMGTELSVVNAAKVSFGKKSAWRNGVKGELTAGDKSLIAFLARGCTSNDWAMLLREMLSRGINSYQEGYSLDETFEEDVDDNYDDLEAIAHYIKKMPSHWSPFAHTALTLHIKMPIFVARQIMKHTTGIEYNEVSRRYVSSDPEFYTPKVWRGKAEDVKQGSSGEIKGYESLFEYESIHEDVQSDFDDSLGLYKHMIDQGVCPEQARMVLPQSMMTEVIMTGNLYSMANLYNQRIDSHAQEETQEVAKQIGEIVEKLFPYSWGELTR